jgi:trimethylamine---corrinoid protein Co-methyltransferase
MNGIVRRICRGMDVNAHTIGAEVIANVGPRGNFFMEDHTLEFLRSAEFRETKVSNKKNYDNWKNDGSPSVVQNANRKARELLATGNKKPLDPVKRQAMSVVIEDFERHIGTR